MSSLYRDRHNAKAIQSAGRHASEEIISTRRKTYRELDGIDERIDRLTLLCEAMWELLEDQHGVTKNDLHRKLVEIDERDGRRDFRRARSAQPCECNAMVPPNALACQFCGAPAPLNSLFDAI